jgi:hypothetical protein
MPTQIGVIGAQSTIGPTFERSLSSQSTIVQYLPIGNATTAHTAIGAAALTAVGTATARNVANTNAFTWRKRLGYVSAAGAGSFAEVYSPTAQILRGGQAGVGGFDVTIAFGNSDAVVVADARIFVGLLASTSTLTNVEPSTLTNMVGIGCEAADTNFRLYVNDGTGTATSIDLGADFPAKTSNQDWYDVRIICLQENPNVIHVEVVRFLANGTCNTFTYAFTTDLPAAGTFLGLRAFKTNNATAAAVGLDLGVISCNLGI